MLFTSSIFLFAFLPAVLVLYYTVLRKNRKLQNAMLVVASLGFYAWGEPAFVFVMIGSITANWIFALLIDKYRCSSRASKIIMTGMVAFNLFLFFIFKYLMFFLKNISSIFDANFNIPEIALPIGISFFTFQAMSYVIDVYRQNGKVQKNILNVMLYISFFPQLIAGPIVRYETIAEQIENRRESLEDVSDGFCRFIVGFSKKILLANNMALIADGVFALENSAAATAWLGIIAYALQIFFDFSAYSDMAIGLGKMFGFHFLENFDYPYISRSITEFWRRWHISLGTWFRDYVYFPMGGSRVESKVRLVFNLFVVWFLTGLWHGANWTFILWGLLYFLLLSIEKLTGLGKTKSRFGHIYTMFFVLMGWVLFRAETVSGAVSYMKSMFGLGYNGLIDSNFSLYLKEYWIFLVAAVIACVPFFKLVPQAIKKHPIARSVATFCTIAFFTVSISYMIKGAYNPFIYFNF